MRPQDEFFDSRGGVLSRIDGAGSAAVRAVIVLGTVTAIGYGLFTRPGSFFTSPAAGPGHHTAVPAPKPVVWRGASYWRWIISSWPVTVVAVAAAIIALVAILAPQRKGQTRPTGDDVGEAAVVRLWLM